MKQSNVSLRQCESDPQDYSPREHTAAQAEPVGSQYPSGGDPANVAPAAPHCPTFEKMRVAKRWVVWSPDKQPYYPNGQPRHGKLDSEVDLRSLGTFEEACSLVSNSDGRFAGVGFALGLDVNGGYWQGINLDDIPQKQLSQLANDVPGYVEISPSRNGIHAIGYGKRFAALGSNGTGIEAYSDGRYFTVTGDIVRDSGLTDLAEYVQHRVAPLYGTKRQVVNENTGAAHVDQTTVTELRSALLHMRSDDYDLWVKMGLALSCLGEIGRGLWLDWSATSDKFAPAEASKKWQTFKPNALNYETVFHAAQEMGWVNPKSNGAQIRRTEASSIFIDTEEPRIVNIEYLQNPWVPDKTVIGCYGRGEAGKSSWAATMAAEISAARSVLWVTSEESPDHIKVRHRYCRGDCGAIGVISSAEFDIYTHFQQAIRDAKTRFDKPLGLVVLDAVVALVVWKKGETANDDGAVKRLIGHIQSVAEAEGVSVLILGHLNKGKGHEHIADAVLGAAAWTTSVRLAYMFRKVPDEDFTGFVRTVKQNMGINFGSFYRTVPVYEMAPNIDGYRPSLCSIQFQDERIYGERALHSAMAEDGDDKTERMNAKQKKIEHGVNTALKVLGDGQIKTRDDIKRAFGSFPFNTRNWISLEDVLVRHEVQITNGERNRKYYQLCIAPLP